MYVSGGIDEKALNVSNDVVHIIEQLRSNHEEADTRMLLHVAYLARQKANRVSDWDCVAAVERLPALHFCVDFIFLSFGIMGFIVEL